MIFITSAMTTRRKPRKITLRQFAQVVEHFNRTGQTVHTAQGVTLAPLLNYLVRHGVPFTLEYNAPYGYCLKKLDPR